MAPKVVIYTDEHFDGVRTLWEQAFPNPKPWNAPEYAVSKKLAAQPNLFIVAVDGDRVIGSAMAGYDGTRGWLYAVAVLEALNRIGSEHGIGRIDLVENRFVGMKSRGCYETPGGALIMFAIRELEALTLDKNTLHYKQKLALDYAEMVYNGLWFTPLREALDGFFEKVGETATGEVKLRLYKGNIDALSRKSPYSLYSLDIASFTMGASYDQKDALGFINLVGLPIKVRAALMSQSATSQTK